MKKNIFNILTLLVVVLMGLSLTACSEDDLDTNQYKGGVSLTVFGPSPVMRGGTLRFIGSNLDQIAQVKIPGCDPITDIEVVKTGTPSEIRVTVPKDGPEVGKITLVTKTDQSIETVSEVTYTEPIVFEGFDKNSVMPGDTVTVKGDYLNLIHSLSFKDDVYISEKNFTAHSRYAISVVVPDSACTGKLSLYDADVTALDQSTDVSYNIVETDSILEIGTPIVSKISSPRGSADLLGTITAKAGEKITITGDYFKLVGGIITGDEEATEGNQSLGVYTFKEFTVSADGKTLTFDLPALAPDGDINLICKSRVEVPCGKLITVAPTNLKANNGQPVKNGNDLVITGNDLDVIVSVTFPNHADAIAVKPSATELKVNVPEDAQEGDIILTMANGKTVKVAYTLVKPAVTGYSANPVSAGGALTITGTNLDLVKTVTFNGSETPVAVTAEQDGTIINLTVPMDAQSGEVTLNLKNGSDVKVASININEAVFCYATTLPTADVKAGGTMVIHVKNVDKLSSIDINGTNCQYVISGDSVIVGVPDNATKTSKLTLVSTNGQISYDISVVPNTESTTVLWSGLVDLGKWSVNWQIGDGTNGASKPTMFADMGLAVGDVIHVGVTKTDDWWQIQFFDGHWNAQNEIGTATGLGNNNNINSGIYDLAANNGNIDITVTQTLLDQLTTLTDWGYCWIIQGENLVVNKISVTHYTSVETTLWSGEVVADGWADQPYLLSDAGAELSAVGAKVGQTIRFYFTPTESDWKVQIVEGHWGDTYASICNTGNDTENGKFVEYDLAGNKGCYALKLTKEILDKALTQQWWGGVFLLNGDNIKCTKVTIE